MTTVPSTVARLLFAPWLAVVPIDVVVEQEDKRSTSRIAGVVGRWSEAVRDGDAVVLVDESVDHTPSAADVDAVSTSLFGRTDASFAENAAAKQAFSLGVLQDVGGFSEGTFRARFKLVSGKTDQTAGLVFDLRHNGEYSFVRYNTREGNIALWRYANGARKVVARSEEKVQLPLGEWHELSMTVTGTRLVGSVNDVLKLEHTLPASVAGRIGFWAKRDSVTEFKDIRVSSNVSPR
jgi:hypothetical protein